VVRFYPLARSAQDQTAAGVVITVTGEVPTLEAVLGPQVQRLGEVFPRVLAPVLSTVEAALTVEERRQLFPWHLHFIHPVLGLTGFEERDGLLPWQLLAAPAVASTQWWAAVPGVVAPTPLRQLTLVQELGFEELLAGEGGDIGSVGPGEGAPGSGLLGKAGGMAAGVLGALGAGLMGALGNGKAAAAVEQWSRRQQEDLSDRRKRELNQLLDRFDKDTLDALRHAIPLTGSEARRGNAATPGWKLGARNPDLDPFSKGSGAVDVWSINAETQLKLEKKYREAAAREAAAGQWGRAAYIHGELLGDWARAAEMLEKGGRPREAARIYMERLRSGLRAAQCMEKAGLLAEAAGLFREAGQIEKAGDLIAALGQPEEARAMWETALGALTNPLEQARLLEEKLGDPDRALLALKSVSVKSAQALACFEACFALLGRLGRHAVAAAWLDDLDRLPHRRLEPGSAMAAGLHTIFSTYPDHAVRDQAASLAPHLIGLALAAQPSRAESGRLLKLLPQFSPGDRLLARDAGRFSLSKHRPTVPLLERSGVTVLRPDLVQGNKGGEWISIRNSGMRPHVRHFRTGKFAEWRRVDGIYQRVDDCLAAGPAANGEFVLLCISETGTLVGNYYGPDGNFRRTRVLDFAPPGLEKGDWFTGGHGPDLWIAGMDVVCCVTEQGDFRHVAIPGPISGFAVAPPVLSSQALAVGGHEVVLLIPHGKGKPVECVNLFTGSSGEPPVVAFTGDGRAVMADGKGGMVWHVRGSCEKQAEVVVPPGSGELVAASAIGARGFAFLTSTGKVLRYKG